MHALIVITTSTRFECNEMRSSYVLIVGVCAICVMFEMLAIRFTVSEDGIFTKVNITILTTGTKKYGKGTETIKKNKRL